MRINLHYLRLAGFPLGLGLTSVLVSGTLNRVLIVERGLPVTLVGLFFAIPLLIAPARLWLGYLSDGYPIAGRRREPYIILGALIAGVGVIGATVVVFHSVELGVAMAAGAALLFLIYGLGYTLASNTFEALLADKFTGVQRPRAVTLFKVAMFIGILGGAVGLGRLLEPFDEARFQMIALGIMGLYALLAAGAVLRQEPRTPTLAATAQRATQLSFFEAVRRIIWVDPQARRFFVMVMLSVTGSLAQDVLLEPYGALVLGMSVAQTTRLTALWGIGTALAMMAAGVTLIARFGYMPVLRAGLLLNVIVFAGIITAGALGSTTLFQGIVFLLGVGTGLATAGLLTAVIEFTTFVRAGLLMGVWGMAHQIGQAMGGLLGGVMVDVVRRLTDGADLIAYGAVFVTEAAMLLTALELSRRLRVDRATAQSESVPFGNESPFGTSHSGADSISRG